MSVHDFQEQLERIQKAMYRIRSNTDLMGIGVMADMIHEYKRLPDIVRDVKGNPRGIPSTMATDGENLYFNPDFVAGLKDSELRFIMLHEMYHIAWHHHLRLGDRDENLANMAMDAIVNANILGTKAYASGFLTWPEGGFRDDRFIGPKWYWEKVYNVLFKEMPPQEGTGDEDDDGPTTWEAVDELPDDYVQSDEGPRDGDTLIDNRSEKEDDGDGEGEGDEGDGGTGKDDEEDSEKGEGGNSTDEGDSDGDSSDQSSSSNSEGGSDAPSGATQWGAVWKGKPKTEAEEREQAEAIDDKLAQGELIERTWGVGGGTDTIVSEIRAVHQEVSSWEFLRELLTSYYADVRTWSRPNVLYQEDHGYLPARMKSSGTLHICLDTSGSMGRQDIEISLANAQAICDEIGIHTLRVSYVDDQIRMPHGEVWTEYDVASGEEVMFEIGGRGGTSFDPIFMNIEEEQEEVTCLIYFTDGEGYVTVAEPNYHVVWATVNRAPMYGSYYDQTTTDEFGEVIYIAKDLDRRYRYY